MIGLSTILRLDECQWASVGLMVFFQVFAVFLDETAYLELLGFKYS